MRCGGGVTSPQHHMGIMNNAVAGYLMHTYVARRPNKRTERRHLKVNTHLDHQCMTCMFTCFGS